MLFIVGVTGFGWGLVQRFGFRRPPLSFTYNAVHEQIRWLSHRVAVGVCLHHHGIRSLSLGQSNFKSQQHTGSFENGPARPTSKVPWVMLGIFPPWSYRPGGRAGKPPPYPWFRYTASAKVVTAENRNTPYGRNSYGRMVLSPCPCPPENSLSTYNSWKSRYVDDTMQELLACDIFKWGWAFGRCARSPNTAHVRRIWFPRLSPSPAVPYSPSQTQPPDLQLYNQ